MSTALAKTDEWPQITKEDVRKFFCAAATDTEVALFLRICELSHLNPFKREAYIVKYGQNPASILTGYEVYLKRAEKSQKWDGMKVWTEGSLNGHASPPTLIAKIEIYRKDWTHPFCHEVEYSEYVQRKQDGSPNKFWNEKPKTMLKKVVVSQGLRLAFPDEVGGLPYTEEEVDPGSIQVTVAVEPEMPRAKPVTASIATEEAQTHPEPIQDVKTAAETILGAQEATLEDLAPSDSRPIPDGYRLMEAKFDGLCKNKECGKQIKRGDQAIFSPKNGLRHPDCA